MTYLLDTNTCIYFLNERSESLTQRIKSTHPRAIVVCSIVKAELYYGALKSTRPVENLHKQKEFLQKFRSLPFDDHAADEYGRLRSRLEKLGTPIGPHDMLIAAIAMAHDVTVVTHNLAEFERVENLKVEDWRI
jgi:tRNA(fMet)-specific endonuclease VapC